MPRGAHVPGGPKTVQSMPNAFISDAHRATNRPGTAVEWLGKEVVSTSARTREFVI